MRRLFRPRFLAPALAIAAAAALSGCVAYPAPGYYGGPYAYGYPAYYAPAPVFGFSFGGWGDRDHWHHRYWR
ncbi:MAG TPA: hypothetical protein VJ779_21105 [Acetobacteraceae bacterium]|jgi:hypothetical protein|nr:hypothetical protein [Acetobacteraceae bacterium]